MNDAIDAFCQGAVFVGLPIVIHGCGRDALDHVLLPLGIQEQAVCSKILGPHHALRE
jgi:hypothetical protein